MLVGGQNCALHGGFKDSASSFRIVDASLPVRVLLVTEVTGFPVETTKFSSDALEENSTDLKNK
ncbi:hypothetical protein Ciccas_006322 [Cichlidogyrus casuarinus]|uniref:Uncharacterized protein n=1 Tax=Cichlidogyrus casuarinus TaxID=1844966 RepID=A0ABD2Q9W7_9PLAT